jgi:type IX secretion system substrate protein
MCTFNSLSKKIILLSVVILISWSNLKSEIPSIPIEYYFKTDNAGYPQMRTFEDRLFLLYRLPETFWVGENNFSLDYYENGKWNNLLGREDSISIFDFDIDKSGNIWVASGRGLFKYDWDKWEKFEIKDSLQNVRDYTNICIDSNNNIWCTTFCGIPSSHSKWAITYKATYSEICIFDGTEFSIKKFRKGGLIGDNYGGINGLVCLPDGRVLIHDALFPYSKIDNIEDDLIIFEKEVPTTTTIQGPHYYTESMPKKVNKIYPDRVGNIWFCLIGSGYNGYDSGLSYIRSDGTWDALGYENGLSYWAKYPSLEDSMFLQTFAIHQDITGRYWVGGNRFFGYLDSELKLRIPNNTFYENCILIVNDWMDAKYENDSTIKKFFYNISRFREIGAPIYWYGSVENIVGNERGELWFGTSIGLLHYTPSTTNINSQDVKEEKFTVYPNPILNTEKYINLVLYGNNKDFVNVKLYSIMGQLVSENQVSFWGDLGRFPLPQNLTSGNYFIEIQSNNNTYTEKIIIK